VSRGYAIVLAAVLVTSSAALSRATGGGSALPRAASSGCRNVGWIADLSPRVPRAYLRLVGPSKSCVCPTKKCARVARDQYLFENEIMFSGDGKITVKSVVKGVPNLTCILPKGSQYVIYPTVAMRSPNDHAVLQLISGAISCQVEQGQWRRSKSNAVFIVNNTILTVVPVTDPVFGMKTVQNGSLIQVKKGVISVSTASGKGSKAVGRDQQVVVSGNGNSLGTVTSLTLDSALRPGLCALTPDLRLTDVRTASGAHPGGNPLGLAPDPNGNIWFTDDATPAIGVYNLTNGKITYPQGGSLRPDSVPRFIVADTAGDIWFTDAGATPAIGMIDPKTNMITEYDLRPGSVPLNPMYDPIHKLVWFTDLHKPTGAIGVIDPRTKAITEYSSGLTPGSHPEGIAVDAKGNVWFTDDNGPSPAIGMLDPTTHEIHEYSSGLVPGSLPRGIMVGPDGNVWFADERTVNNRKSNAPGDGLIGMIGTTDPKHQIVEYAVEANGGNRQSIPEGLAWYRGYVWFTDDGATKAIGRIDPSTGAITESSKGLVPDSKPIGILVSRNVLWFTDRLKNSPKIGRLEAKPSC
jgi:streptogramin lyase